MSVLPNRVRMAGHVMMVTENTRVCVSKDTQESIAMKVSNLLDILFGVCVCVFCLFVCLLVYGLW